MQIEGKYLHYLHYVHQSKIRRVRSKLSAETLEKVYIALTFEPQTPNEIAEKIDLNQHTVQGALLELGYQVEEDREVQVILESKIRRNMEEKFHSGKFLLTKNFSC